MLPGLAQLKIAWKEKCCEGRALDAQDPDDRNDKPLVHIVGQLDIKVTFLKDS